MPGFEFSNLDSLYLLSMYDSVDLWVDGAHAAADHDKVDGNVESDGDRRQVHADEVDHV